MVRRSGHERETLRISADAATKLLVKLHEARTHLDERIANLQAVVDAWESISGKRVKVEAVPAGGATRQRHPKGQVSAQIEQILQDGREYDEPTLRKALEEKFGATYTRATVYTSLRRGAAENKFIPSGKKWSLNPMRVAQET